MLITLDNVGKSYGIDVIVQGISAVVNENDRIGIIGENGAGKTTLLNMLMGMLENDEGEIIFADNVTIGYLKQTDGLNPNNTLYKEMETVYSEVFNAIKDIELIEKQLAVTPNDEQLIEKHHSLQNIIYSRDGYNTDFHIKKMLNGMGFTEEEHSKMVGVLSGGERTRLNLAKLLLENPDILILDEPTNHLDFDTLTWLEDYLSSYKGAIITVSHDRFFLDKLVKRIWEVEDTYLYEYKGNYSAFSVLKEEKLKLQQKQYEADMEKVAKLEDYVAKNLVRASTSNMAKSRRKQLEKMEVSEKPKAVRVPLKFKFEFDVKPYDEVLYVDNLEVHAGGKKLIENLNLDIRRGERLIIAGANGTGKTTLLNTITGRNRPVNGKVKLGTGVKPAIFDQYIVNKTGSIIDNIWALRPKWTQLEVRNYLARFGFRGEDVFKESSALSGGEKARMRFCEISLDRANLLFLDEPTNHLDIYMREAITNALMGYEGTIVVITHDRFLMKSLDCPIMCLENKTGVFYKDFDDFMAKRSASQFMVKKTVDKAVKEEKVQVQLNQKEQRRKAAQDRARFKECEREIEQLQEKLDQYQLDMQNVEIVSDHEKMAALWQNMEDDKQKMDALMDEWAELAERLEG
ncbi:MAG: ABC-F family ATP-binding cassette domain-containing protein [Oscillospiraceae bacterium]|nr:ABC-F family ATP-binding cassette domain-containing protein [Oscillospiraceae bacterium]